MLCVRAATVRVGIKGDAECVIQGFSSSLTRLHCIIDPAGLPPPTMYDSDGAFQDLPLCGYHPITTPSTPRAQGPLPSAPTTARPLTAALTALTTARQPQL